MEARLIIDEPAAGAWNMAVDEALLESASRNGVATLRFYRWSEPTLSLGYFQRIADRQIHAPSAACPCVRRATGGGAIVHDHELTYSFAAPLPERGGFDGSSLYDAFHQTLIEELASIGLAATPSEARPLGTCEPFLCFQRRSTRDVIVRDSKICGSAQRQRRRAVLQHGSLLIRQSLAAPELVGVEDVTGQTVGVAALVQGWQRRVSKRLSVQFVPSFLTEPEARCADELRTAKFDSPSWNNRR